MGFDQKGTPVFSVGQRASGQWDVCEEGFEKPLASFNNEQDARKYAEDLARTKQGSQVRSSNGAQSGNGAGRNFPPGGPRRARGWRVGSRAPRPGAWEFTALAPVRP